MSRLFEMSSSRYPVLEFNNLDMSSEIIAMKCEGFAGSRYDRQQSQFERFGVLP